VTRRSLLLALALATLPLASCATFDHADDVAEVEGRTLDEDTFAEIMDSPIGIDLAGVAPVEGVVAGSSARDFLQSWVVLNAVDASGLVDESGAEDARAEIAAQYGAEWDASPPEAQELSVLNGLIGVALQNGEVDEQSLIDFVRNADIRVDPRYGRWDPETLRIEALG
jgi:hypothetical protein